MRVVATSRGGRRRRGRASVLVAALAAAVLAASCGGTPEGRLDSSPESGGDQDVQVEDPQSVETSTTLGGEAPAAPAQGRESTNRNKLCRGRADSFLPDQVAGYTVAGSGDLAGALPPGASGIQSAGAASLRRDADGSQALVSAIVFDEAMAATPLVQSTVDLFLQAAGGRSGVADTTVGGFAAKTAAGPNGSTVYAWQECLNVFVIVQAPDAQMGLDIATKVHSP